VSDELPSWFFRPRKKRWIKQEERIAKENRGKRQPGSGNQPFDKGDVKSDVFLYEAKSTDKQSFRLTSDMIQKIAGETIEAGSREKKEKKWALEILMKDRNQDDLMVYVISRDDFYILRQLLGEEK